MKKFLATICVAAMCAVAVCALAGCDLVAEVDVDKLYRRCNVHRDIPFDGDSVTVQADSYNVYVEELEFGNSVTLDYVQGATAIEYRIDNGDVTIAQHGTAGDDAFLIVGIPEHNLQHRTMQLTVKVGAGNVQVDDIEASVLTVAVTTGDVRLDGCFCGSAEVSAQTGNVMAELEGEACTVDVGTGNVHIDLEVRDISLTVAEGWVKGSVEHPQYWYDIDAHTGSGSCNLDRRSSNGNYKLAVSVGKGDIKIAFDKD